MQDRPRRTQALRSRGDPATIKGSPTYRSGRGCSPGCNGAVTRKAVDPPPDNGAVTRKAVDPPPGNGAVTRKAVDPPPGNGAVTRKAVDPPPGNGAVAPARDRPPPDQRGGCLGHPTPPISILPRLTHFRASRSPSSSTATPSPAGSRSSVRGGPRTRGPARIALTLDLDTGCLRRPCLPSSIPEAGLGSREVRACARSSAPFLSRRAMCRLGGGSAGARSAVLSSDPPWLRRAGRNDRARGKPCGEHNGKTSS
jgi:hypothetical protein